MAYFWNYSLADFGCWIPSAWNNKRLEQEWPRKEFGGEKASHYGLPRKPLELSPEPESSH
jgi:hypothetical protein